jgi:hypothetical protein
MLFVTGPGHGGPALLANTWLEGTYTEAFPAAGADPILLWTVTKVLAGRDLSPCAGFVPDASLEV